MKMPSAKLISILPCAAALAMSLSALPAAAQKGPFMLSSPDLPMGTFDNKFVLNGFGCKGGNVSPALEWQNVPVGTKSLALQVFDPDAPTGAGFWHWTVYNIPPNTTTLPQGAGNSPAGLPAPAYGGASDYSDTGATGGNGNYGGPCPPLADKPHHYIFTLYALAVDDVHTAGGIPKTGSPSLYSFVLNKGLGDKLIEKASFTATYGR